MNPDIWLHQGHDLFFLPGMNEKTRGIGSSQQPSWNHVGSQTWNKVSTVEGRAKRQKQTGCLGKAVPGTRFLLWTFQLYEPINSIYYLSKTESGFLIGTTESV